MSILQIRIVGGTSYHSCLYEPMFCIDMLLCQFSMLVRMLVHDTNLLFWGQVVDA
jgi:hypothetical protein